MAQVYAIVHNGKGDFIIALKNKEGYFFHNKKGSGGVIYPNGGGLLNGGGKLAFPGGEIEGPKDQKNIFANGVKELLEETGFKIYEVLTLPALFVGKNNAYYGVYFNVATRLEEVFISIAASLEQGRKAVTAIQDKKYGAKEYDKLLADFKCPADNELSGVYLWSFAKNEKDIDNLLKDKATDWFYYILENLKKYSLNS